GVRMGDARVVVGTRSAIFAPLENVGLIIVDEEQETSYKQEDTPRYHGRDVAIVRAKMENAVALLGSATPSMESYYHAGNGKYELLTLSSRVADRSLAGVEIVDLREEFRQTHQTSPISSKLHAAQPPRMSLLRFHSGGPETLSQVPVEIHLFFWRGLGAPGRTPAQGISGRPHRAAGPRHRANQAPVPGNARSVCRRRAGYSR